MKTTGGSMRERRRPIATSKTSIGTDATSRPPAIVIRTTPLATAIVAALHPGSAALAQRADESGRLEEIVVTATRRELNLQTVSQSITAFSTDDIEKQAFQNTQDIVNALPSVNLVAN